MSMFGQSRERDAMKAIAKVIKNHFPNLSVEKVLDISIEILDATDYLREK
jgi:hypothetical protein